MVAVAAKVTFALLANQVVLGFLKEHLSYPALVAVGGLYVGLQSSLCEIGLTLVAVLIWRQLGRDADRAIGIGVGAGAFEAFLLGLAALGTAVAMLAEVKGIESIRENLDQVAAITPLFWLVGPVERIIAILGHTSTRALALLGAVHGRPTMIFWGFAIFTLQDGITGAAHVSGKLGTFSTWWLELAFVPVGLISIPIIRWCRTRWSGSGAVSGNGAAST